jgi:hypothetical protein
MRIDLINEIKTFLAAPSDYTRGVQLLYSVNKSEALRSSLNRYIDKEKLKKYLSLELQNLQTENPEASEPEETISTATVPLPSDTVVAEIEAKMIPLYKELSYYHTLMSHEPDKEIRFSYMKKLIDLDIQLASMRYDINFYKFYRKLPERVSTPKADKCSETLREIIINLKKIPASIYADEKVLKKLRQELKETETIKDIERINNRIAEVETRMNHKKIERRRLEAALKSRQS